jgi:hypothetical protein
VVLCAKPIAGIFASSQQVEGIVYPLILIRGELIRGDSARSRSRRTRRSSKNQIRKKLAKPAAGNLKLQVARGTVQPAEINEQRDLSPRFRRFRRKTNIAQHARYMCGAFFLDPRYTSSNTLVAASPRAQRRFPTRARKISAMLDEARPTRRSLRRDHRIIQPSDLVAFPTVQHFRQQLFAVLKMPIEAALADAQIARQQFDAHGLNSLVGKARERGANPIVGLQWRRFKRGCRSHVVFYVCRGTIPECIERVKLRNCYDFAIASAAAEISGASPKPASQCTLDSLRNQVS